MREGEPMMLTNYFVDRPCTIILGCMFVLIMISLISFLLGYFEMDNPSDREFLIWDDKRTISWDMQTVAKEYLKAAEEGEGQKALRT